MISIALPSIYPEACARTLCNVRDATRSRYEVILVSPFEPPRGHRHVWWIKEEPRDATGCTAAHARAAEHFAGDYVLPWADDQIFVDGWDVATLRNYGRREEAFHRSFPGKPFVLGLHHCQPRHVGTEFGIYYPYFPFLRRAYVERLGWFDPAYRKGFADSDFAMRVWSAGGRCEWQEGSQIIVHPDDGRKAGSVFAQADMELFVQRWAPLYGKGWRTRHIRDFNIDVEPESFPMLVSDNTFFVNEPSFRAKVLP